ncbi:MAG: hypothetical protein NTW65_01195 [Deltaproteobacteria bacterium]|nr:hypothetical protein [Deltaproteobacteria bacterium]
MKKIILPILLLFSLFFISGCVPGSVNGSQPQFKTIEVKHFTQADGLVISQDFFNGFYDRFRKYLKELQVAGQIIEEGATMPDADAANAVVVEGKFTDYKNAGWFERAVVSLEVNLYRKSDHTLIKTIPVMLHDNTPFDKVKGEKMGRYTANEIYKALK